MAEKRKFPPSTAVLCSRTACTKSFRRMAGAPFACRNILRGSSKQDLSALGPEIQTLMPGECLIVNLQAPFAVPAKVHLWADAVRASPTPPAPRPTAKPNISALVD